eukprot:m51a1_g4346 putative calcium-dependent protein (566) ;mRNA; r:203984-206277
MRGSFPSRRYCPKRDTRPVSVRGAGRGKVPVRGLKADQPLTSLYAFDANGDLLGQGAAGSVYRAVRRADGAEVAVKVMAKGRDSRPAFEARIMHSLDHPHIVHLFEALESPSHFYMAMELVKGGDMLDRVSKDKSYCEHRAREIVAQILEAVDHMHSRGVIHRDIKLDNFLLSDGSDEATIKIADFDLSCFDNESRELCVIMCARTSSPRPYSRMCDMWSIGIVLYILLAGRAPFSLDNSDDDWMEDTLTGSPTFEEEQWKTISPMAIDLVRNLLTSKPSERPTAKQALGHPWFKAELRGREPLPEAAHGLRMFNARHKLKGAIRGVLAAQMLQHKVSLLTKIAVSTRPSELNLYIESAHPTARAATARPASAFSSPRSTATQESGSPRRTDATQGPSRLPQQPMDEIYRVRNATASPIPPPLERPAAMLRVDSDVAAAQQTDRRELVAINLSQRALPPLEQQTLDESGSLVSEDVDFLDLAESQGTCGDSLSLLFLVDDVAIEKELGNLEVRVEREHKKMIVQAVKEMARQLAREQDSLDRRSGHYRKGLRHLFARTHASPTVI